MRYTSPLVAGFVVGLVTASACGTVTKTGPTALVLEVYFSELRGTKALLVSGTAELDGVLVNVFPTSQRPEELTGAAFQAPQTVRVLLNDSRGGQPLQLTVIGINAEGDVVEAATQTVTPVLKEETLVNVSLKPFADALEPGGTVNDAGFVFDAGSSSVPCRCPTGCCDQTGGCASTRTIALASRQSLTVVLAGPLNQACTTVCPLGKSSQFATQCLCGTSPACGEGLRCSGTGATARCVCDAFSGCKGCCSNGLTCESRAVNASCGNAGNACARCVGTASFCQATGRCSGAMCVPPSPTNQAQCCSGLGMVDAGWPTCASATGECLACDVLRSNSCRPAGVGLAANPCACGDVGQCPFEQLCLPTTSGRAACTKP
jgi:hypothetical protein